MEEFKLLELSTYCISGVYCFINDSTKQVYLGYGHNILNSLQRILTQYKSNLIPNQGLSTLLQDLSNIEFKIIETVSDDKFLLKERTSYWCRLYKKLGYEVLNKVPINLSIVTYIEENSIYVVLRSNNRKERVLGVFKSNSEVEGFVSTYKSNNLYE